MMQSTNQARKCPFFHGTVDAAPYPGYVHGKRPEICSTGCKPVINPSATETAVETLTREAREYCDLYHKEKRLHESVRDSRWADISASIALKGTYDLTTDELEHGARVAWRNAPKCANRAKWAELTIADCRGITTNSEAFAAILELLEGSLASGATITRMAVFRPRGPNEVQGPRIWNGSLLRFAGYASGSPVSPSSHSPSSSGAGPPALPVGGLSGSSSSGGIMGDPADAGLTAALIDRFGWVPPEPRSQWDPLPLLLQMEEGQPPELFSLPSSYVPIVPISHPDMPGLAPLGLRWFGIPVVSGMEMSIGGLAFTAAP